MTNEQKQLIEDYILALSDAATSKITVSSRNVYVKKLSFAAEHIPTWNNDNIINRIEHDVENSECTIAQEGNYQFVLKVTIPG